MTERNVLKENEIILVSDEAGDIASHNADGHGLYWRDTRFLSLYELRIEGFHPTLLSAAGEHNFMNNLQFANAAFVSDAGRHVPARTISIRRNRFIHDGLHERIGFLNWNQFAITLRVSLTVGSDFRDMFDVRGYTRRPAHGAIEAPRVDGELVELGYLGLDGLRRATRLRFDPTPTTARLTDLDAQQQIEERVLPGISGRGDLRTEYRVTPPSVELSFVLELAPRQSRSITVNIEAGVDDRSAIQTVEALSLDAQFLLIRDSYLDWESAASSIETDHEVLNSVIQRSLRDLRLLSDRQEAGYVPAAGIPWFSVPFGRDSLITAMQTLCLQPELAYGSLKFLAKHQGRQIDDWRDEEPGKILHEVRLGELATLGQVPHTPYFGSVDSTPLFLFALGELVCWTDDLALLQSLRPNFEAALTWLDHYGDLDGDGYVEYRSRSRNGIRNQGWKDSIDAIAYPDGRAVEPPIALVEVQGYVYAARMAAARCLRRLDEPGRAEGQEALAADLRRRFKRDFRFADGSYYALALDAMKQPVEVVSSNPGHCLWTGLLDDQDGRELALRMTEEDLDCGWGLRTLSSRETSFNPMSYHNGSVWPHDNALVAAGFKRLGLDRQATNLITEVLEAAMRFPRQRLPELYCGFTRDRRYFSIPAQYPVSCSPQAWAAGSVFMMLQTLLGLRVDAAAGRLTLRPLLPDWLGRITVRRLRVGERRVDFEVYRQGEGVNVEIRSSGGLELLVEPPPPESVH